MLDPVKLLGIVGLVGVVAAWIPPTIRTIQNRSTELPLSFLSLAVVGNVCLTAYSFINFEPIYLCLNLFASLQGCINLFFKLFPRTT